MLGMCIPAESAGRGSAQQAGFLGQQVGVRSAGGGRGVRQGGVSRVHQANR